MSLYIYTEGEKVIGKGFAPLAKADSHEVGAAEFNSIDTELIETGLYLYGDSGLSEDSNVRLMLSSAEIRTLRNALLSECDWTQLADAPLTTEEKSLWASYRQTLRDIPQQENFPLSVCFPEKPAE